MVGSVKNFLFENSNVEVDLLFKNFLFAFLCKRLHKSVKEVINTYKILKSETILIETTCSRIFALFRTVYAVR